VDREELKQLFDTLQRYAGWLDRDRTSVMVRSAVQALGTAMDTGGDPSPLLQTLDTNIARLPSGELVENAARRRGRDPSRSSRSRDDLGSAPALKKHHDRLRDSCFQSP
jgi:hypothetical protein